MKRRILFVLAGTMLIAFAPLRSQSAGSTAVLSGRITQAGDTSIAIGGADIEIVGTARRQYADNEGRFRFTDLMPGTYELRVRRLGYESALQRVVLAGAPAREQSIELSRHPHALTEVRINGETLKVPARYEDVYARAAHEHGTFFLRQDIERLNPYDVGSLLNLVPTVYANDRGVTFQRCNSGLNGVSASSPGRATQAVQVYVDGTRETANPLTSVKEAIQVVKPRDIEAVEVYSGVSRIPAEFINDACAVIAIWTKSY